MKNASEQISEGLEPDQSQPLGPATMLALLQLQPEWWSDVPSICTTKLLPGGKSNPDGHGNGMGGPPGKAEDSSHGSTTVMRYDLPSTSEKQSSFEQADDAQRRISPTSDTHGKEQDDTEVLSDFDAGPVKGFGAS